ncbi:Glutathione S-transferase [hydrothermal vent metagenome]|uniref:Glutathione S-transferase n=1 Tax=hydrothermal vent metagenome TaxID=652676 RepID=A0A3B0SGA4_9ZZZZ
MYTLIGTRASRAFRVLWLLEELGEPYAHTPAAPGSDDIRALNPSGKIPALVVDDTVLTDSVAIMTYLTDKHGAFTTPPGSLERAHQDAMTLQILDDIDALLWMAGRHTFILPKEHRVAEIKPSLMWEYGRNLTRISDAFTGPFVMGDKMTVPDILLTYCLRWAAMFGFPAPDEKLTAYMARMQERPALQRAADLP